jgi:hypothetical protein
MFQTSNSGVDGVNGWFIGGPYAGWGGDLQFVLLGVPEPGAAVLLAVASLSLAARRRR